MRGIGYDRLAPILNFLPSNISKSPFIVCVQNDRDSVSDLARSTPYGVTFETGLPRRESNQQFCQRAKKKKKIETSDGNFCGRGYISFDSFEFAKLKAKPLHSTSDYYGGQVLLTNILHDFLHFLHPN